MSSFELPLATTDARRPSVTRERYVELAGRVKVLSWLSLVWMTIEGGVAIVAGIVAGSVALVGFGLDSAIEGFASVVIIWRFTGSRTFSHTAEQRAQKLVAIQFFLLAPYVGYESIDALVSGEPPGGELGGDRVVGGVGGLHADARNRQAAARRLNGLRGDRRRRPSEHVVRLPRGRAADRSAR